MLRATYIPGQIDLDFFAYNSAEEVWNGTEYEEYSEANILTYRIAATEKPLNSGRYQGPEPAGAVEFELRLRRATLAESQVVAGPEQCVITRTKIAATPNTLTERLS